jgi:hypothetical protein
MIKTLRKSYVNYRGWTTKRKLVLIESDDWGSIRMPNKKTYDKLYEEGLPIHKSRYSKYDALESKNDLERLYETLNSVKDFNDNGAVLTANYLVANPDFDKIRKDNFNNYYYENVLKTYERFNNVTEIKDLIFNGINDNIFYPQFHGREHIHPLRWLYAVNNCPNERLCFENNAIPGVPINCSPETSKKFLASFDYYDESEKSFNEKTLVDGLKMFEKIFGYKSKSFIAPQSVRGNHLNKLLFEGGVLYHQNGQQLLPSLENQENKIVNHFWGHVDNAKMLSWRRNVTFEPSKNPNFDSVTEAMKEIKNAFFWGKPAVINSHRVNFIGSLSEANQLDSLSKLKELLLKVIKTWPDVEFVNSEQLGNYMSLTKNNS